MHGLQDSPPQHSHRPVSGGALTAPLAGPPRGPNACWHSTAHHTHTQKLAVSVTGVYLLPVFILSATCFRARQCCGAWPTPQALYTPPMRLAYQMLPPPHSYASTHASVHSPVVLCAEGVPTLCCQVLQQPLSSRITTQVQLSSREAQQHTRPGPTPTPVTKHLHLIQHSHLQQYHTHTTHRHFLCAAAASCVV